ncbi:SMI1/KNR4 family protein [Streptomyces sp. NPDC056910]|uniref:SMI1/KNR4 family protein n=1 Tax=Streptomyces sp. NPDC056910 TaxID=3345964 RepID=UPI0036C9B1CD
MNLPAAPQPLTEAEVAEAEAQLGVGFPHEYRRYLLRVSAGGAVAQLEKTENGWWWAGNSTRRRDLLSLPFPIPSPTRTPMTSSICVCLRLKTTRTRTRSRRP